MISIRIICVGKKSSQELASLIEVYQKRLAARYNIDWRLISASKKSSDQRVSESQDILKLIKQNDFVILLDEVGQEVSNSQLAKLFERELSAININGKRSLTFIIGGAYGVIDELRERADFIWSLSKLVFPHQLVRLILIEQLYRTDCLLADHPYHHQ